MKNLTDYEIIGAFKAGGPKAELALGQLYRDIGYWHLASEAVQSFGGGVDDVKDLVQEGLWRLYKKIRTGGFEERSSVKTFFGGIVKNIARNEQAKRARTALHLENLASTAEEAQPEDLSWAEITGLLDIAYGQIEPKCKELLDRWSVGYSLNELQAEFGYKDFEALKNKKKNCLKWLREWMLRHPEAVKYFKKK